MKTHSTGMKLSNVFHKWLSAVLPSSDTDIMLSQIVRNIKTMNSWNSKSKHSNSIFCRKRSDELKIILLHEIPLPILSCQER